MKEYIIDFSKYLKYSSMMESSLNDSHKLFRLIKLNKNLLDFIYKNRLKIINWNSNTTTAAVIFYDNNETYYVVHKRRLKKLSFVPFYKEGGQITHIDGEVPYFIKSVAFIRVKNKNIYAKFKLLA